MTLSGIPPKMRGEAQIEVTFTIDTNGILNVRAREVKSNLQTQARIVVVGAPDRPGGDGAVSPHAPAVG
jgi:molecular chaperone DnaK (HSP70)